MTLGSNPQQCRPKESPYRRRIAILLNAKGKNVAKPFLGLALLLIALAVGACSTVAKTTTREVVAPRIINSPAPGSVGGELHIHLDRMFAPLASRGFELGRSGEADALTFDVSFDPSVFNTQVRITLTRNGQELVRVESTNGGWGTGIARSAAIANLVEAATLEFDRQLSGMKVVAQNHAASGQRTSAVPRPSMEIESKDAAASVTRNRIERSQSRDVYSELIKLDDLRKKGILTDAEFEAEKRKLLSDR